MDSFEIVLEAYRELPEDDQPSFEFRYLSGAEYLRKAELLEKSHAMKGFAGPFQAMGEAIVRDLVGWKNQRDLRTGDPVEFDPDRLGDVLEACHYFDLLASELTGNNLSPEIKKKWQSASRSATAPSRPVSGAPESGPGTDRATADASARPATTPEPSSTVPNAEAEAAVNAAAGVSGL